MLVFCDSFSNYNVLANKWTVINSGTNPSISALAARSGSAGLAAGNPAGPSGARKTVPTIATGIVGVAFQAPTAPGGLRDILRFFDGLGNATQVCIAVDATGGLHAYRGEIGTLLGTASSGVSIGVYHYLECEVTISSTVGVVTLRVDGVTVLSLTGQNTQNTANASFSAFDIGQLTNVADAVVFYFADVYYCDTTGSHNNSFLGDVSVLSQLPSANGTTNNYTNVFATFLNSNAYLVGQTISDGTHIQRCTTAGTSQSSGTPSWNGTLGGTTTTGGATFTNKGTPANWLAVNENPPDDNDSYVTDATVSDQDRYTYPSITGSQVFAAVVNLRADKDDSGTRTIRAVTKSGSTVADSGTDFPLTLNSFADFQGIFETDPNTSSPWTVAGVNAAEFGVKTEA